MFSYANKKIVQFLRVRKDIYYRSLSQPRNAYTNQNHVFDAQYSMVHKINAIGRRNLIEPLILGFIVLTHNDDSVEWLLQIKRNINCVYLCTDRWQN
jgi:hypothetical protein